MSNTLAIAAVTNAIRNLLQSELPSLDAELSDLDVTTRTPDTARKSLAGTSLNVFLYEAVSNAAWRNQDLPAQVRPGEAGSPPLALNLHYLLTSYARDDADQEAVSHRVLAGAMSVLHDHPVLNGSELAAALTNNDVAAQPERIRITPLQLSMDDMSKLWTAFQTNFRLSAAYEATVLLIESRNPVRSPLPVLARGAQDTGVATMAGTAAVLKGLIPPDSQPAARLGERVAVVGNNLTAAQTVIRFTSLWHVPEGEPPAEQVELSPVPGDRAGRLDVVVPDQPDDAAAFGRWVPGFYTAAAVTARLGLPVAASNEVGFALAPQITVTPHGEAAVAIGGILTATCVPRIRDGQRVLLLLGDRQLAPETLANPASGDPGFDTIPTTLTFTVPALDPGTYLVRLRVDGVDSIPVLRAGPRKLASFDPDQQVNVP
jgi:hypothetical protein